MRTILCYGDSNTYGYDPRVFPDDRYEKKIRWTGILDETIDGCVLNYGLNGRCIPHTKNQINAFLELMNTCAKKIFSMEIWIMLGTNDLLTNEAAGAEGVAERMRNFLSIVCQEEIVKSKKVRIRLLSPARMRRGSWVETNALCEESKRMGEYYEMLAKEFDIPCIRVDQIEIPLLCDGVHFSEEGHRKLAEYLSGMIGEEYKA